MIKTVHEWIELYVFKHMFTILDHIYTNEGFPMNNVLEYLKGFLLSYYMYLQKIMQLSAFGTDMTYASILDLSYYHMNER